MKMEKKRDYDYKRFAHRMIFSLWNSARAIMHDFTAMKFYKTPVS